MKFESQLQIVTAAGVPPVTVNQTALVINFNADLLDGQHGSYYAAASSLGNYLPLTGGTLTGTLTGTIGIFTTVRTTELTSLLGSNGPITITPDGTGHVHINSTDIRLGPNNTNATLATRGTGDLILRTNEGSAVEGFIRIYDGANGNIEITPNGTGTVVVGKLSGSTASFSGVVTSTVATGTAPLVVASTTAVTNLNADLLDGQHGSFYQNAGNLNAGTVPLARLSGSYNIDITGSSAFIFVNDTRSSVTGPQTGYRQVRADFLANSTDGLSDGGIYHGVLTFQQWADASGGGTRQLAFTDNDNLWIRGSGTGLTAYNAWKLMLNSVNFSSYALPLTGGTLTGALTGTSASFSGLVTIDNSTPSDILRLKSGGSTVWKLGVTDASGSYLNITADFGNVTIYKLNGNITTPGAFVSTVATGTAPLSVTSTTLVSNLNSDYLDGQHGSYYENRDATAVGFSGGTLTLTRAAGNLSVSLDGRYLPLAGGTMSGDLTATRIRGVNSLVLNTFTTVNPASNVFLYSQPNDRDAWIFLDSADTGSNWGIYHRQIDSAVSGLPANSIGFIGGGSSALQAWISLANGSAGFTGTVSAGSFSGPGTGLTGNASSLTAGAVPWSGVTGKPTTLAGYGITDALNTSATAQTKSGNLTVNGALTSGGAFYAATTVQYSNRQPIYTLFHGGAQDLAWKKIADVTLGTGLYRCTTFKIDVVDNQSNFGYNSACFPMTYFVSCRRSGGVQDDYNDATVFGPVADYVRVVKTATGVYEIQIRQIADWLTHIFTVENTINGSGTVTYATGTPANGSTTGTIYTATAGWTQRFASVSAAGQITSTVATGTAPLVVASTTAVTNLNADLLDGQHGSYFENRDTTAVGFSGGTITLTRAAGNLTVSLDGRYLPLSGGTTSGAVTFGSAVVFGSSGKGRIYADWAADSSTRSFFAGRNSTDTDWNWGAEFGWDGANQRWYFDTVPFIGGNAALHAGNYSSYALPLTGGTLTGELTIATGAASGLRVNSPSGTQGFWLRVGYDTNGTATPVASALNTMLQSSGSSAGTFTIVCGNTKTATLSNTSANFAVALQQNGNQVLHAGNVSTYALPIAGGTITSNLAVSGTLTVTGITYANGGLQTTAGQFTGPLLVNNDNGVRASYDNGGSFAWLYGYGVEFGRATSYARPNTNRSATLFVGGPSINTYDWLNIDFYSSGRFTINNNAILHAGNYASVIGYTPAYGTASYQTKSLDTVGTPGLYQYDGGFAGTKPPDNSPNYRTVEIGSGGRFSQIALPWNSDGFYFRRQVNSTFTDWRTVLHDGNYSSYALPLTGGTLTGTLTVPTLQLANGFQIQQGASNYGQFNTWVHLNGSYGFYSSVNGAHLYPNNGSYGSWRMDGSRNGWGGIEFGNGVSLMMGSDTVGFHQNTNGWLLRVHQGVGYVYKGSWGGGTAAAILDSSNYSSYRGNQLVSPNGGTVVAADSAMPDAVNSFIHTLGLGPSGNDGHILGMTWTGLTTYGAQIWIDTDPNNRMAFRSRSSTGVWTGWNEIIHSSNYSSYALPLSGGTLTGALAGTSASFSGALSSGGNSVLTVGNYSSYAVDNTKRFKQFFWDGLSASTTQARRFEIARISVDTANWNATGTFEVEVSDTYYDRGLKKRYVVWYGYNIPKSGIKLVEMIGAGDNNYQVTIGTPQPITGNQYYLPVYVEVRYYGIAAVRVKTTHQITSNSTPPVGYAYINSSPTPTNITDFTADSTVDLSNAASAWQVGGNTLLHSGNYSSYALPLSGGTITGNLTINGNVGIGGTPYFKLHTYGIIGASDPTYNGSGGAGGTLIAALLNNDGTSPGLDLRRWTGSASTHGTTYICTDSTGKTYFYNGQQSTNTRATVLGMTLDTSGNLSAVGTITGTRLISSIATGTAPLSITSTTLVSNLNVDYLDGQHGSYYQNAGNLNAGTLLAARLPAFTGGDVTSTAGTVALTLANSGVTAGTYRSVTVDSKGRVTAGTNPTTFSGYGISDIAYGSTGSRNVWTITDWNQTTYGNAHFLSSENSHTNGPSSDFIYGLQTAFHRSGSAYRTQMVTELYSSPVSIWVRNSRDSDVWTSWSKLLHSNNYNSYVLSASGTAASLSIGGSAGSVPASGITGQTGMWTSATRPGPYRLYRRDSDSNYSVQTYWTGSYWRLYGYNGDTAHADTHVGYADSAGSVSTIADGAVSTTAKLANSVVTYAKIQNVGAASVLGNPSASVSQAPQEITFANLGPYINGVARAWVTFNENPSTGAITINASFGISSVTRLAAGVYQVNFSTAFSDTHYAVSGTIGYESISAYTNGGYLGLTRTANPKTTTSCEVAALYGGTNYNARFIHVVFHR